jgi:hypothetical protein
MRAVRPAGPVFFPLDEELELLPGDLTPSLVESLVRLGTWVPFRPAAGMLAHFTRVRVGATTARRLTTQTQAGTAHAAVQTAPGSPKSPSMTRSGPSQPRRAPPFRAWGQRSLPCATRGWRVRRTQPGFSPLVASPLRPSFRWWRRRPPARPGRPSPDRREALPVPADTGRSRSQGTRWHGASASAVVRSHCRFHPFLLGCKPSGQTPHR